MIDKVKIFLFYIACFLLIFLQFPLSGSLAGKTDCWWHLAVFSDFENRLSAMTHHLPITTSYFPAKALWLYGEPSFGVGLFYMIIHAIVPDYIWSFYLLYVFLFSLTAFAFYLLAGEFVPARLPRIAGGFFFTSANFALGHLDHHNTFFWAIPLFSVLFLCRFINSKKPSQLYLMFILWGVQIYFSTTIFIYLSLWIAVLLGADYKVWTTQKLWYHFILGGLIGFGLALPFISLYVFNPELKNVYDPALFANGNVISNLWPRDLIRFLPGNLIYPMQTDITFDLLYNIKCAAPGIVLFTLFISGIKFMPKKTFLPIAVIGLILALGSEIKIDSWSIPMPMKLYYSNFPFSPFLRTPIRAYFLVHWVLCMGAVGGLSRLNGKSSVRLPVILLAAGLFFLENLPAALPAAKADQIISESKKLSNFLSSQSEGNVLHLPSQLFPKFPIEENDFGMNVIGREYLYSFMQTMYKKNTVSGSSGYIPRKRITIDEVLQSRSRSGFESMLREYNIKYIVLYHDLMLKSESSIADSLAAYPFLHLGARIDSCYVYIAD